MSDITINYKGNAIATMDASGTKTLLTDGKYCEDDIEVVYVKPSGGGSSVLSGTFTPASDVDTATISALAGTTLKRFLLKITGNIGSGKNQSKRAFLFCYIDFDKDCSVHIATNSTGSASTYSGGFSPLSNNTVYSLDRTTGVFTVNTTVNNGGLLMSGFTYDWIAW